MYKIILCFCFGIQNNFCTQHDLNLYISCTEVGYSMNNQSYCGLTDSRMSASDIDLPVKFELYVSSKYVHTF